jgi:D-amino-acid dehydrogenase
MDAIGVRAPLGAERGYHVVVDHKPLGFDMCLGSHERGFFITPMDGGLRLAGTVEFSPAGKILAANWKRADILKTHVAELLPGVAGEETGRWMGHRPTLPDFLPALGHAPGLENLYLSFGHQHLGLTLAPVSAEILSGLVAGGKTALDISPFDILRFG